VVKAVVHQVAAVEKVRLDNHLLLEPVTAELVKKTP
jgi:hypothetical protein